MTTNQKQSAIKRRNNGQALVEGVCALYLIVLVMVAAIALVFTVGAISYYKIKLSIIGATAARQTVNATYWLGARRPEFDAGKAETDAIELVKSQAKILGLPPLRDQDIEVTQDFTNTKVCKVQIKMNYVPLIGGSFLPSALPIVETGVEPYLIDSPTGVMGLAFNLGGGKGRGFWIPCYGRGVDFQDGVLSNAHPRFQVYPEGKFPVWQTTTIETGAVSEIGPDETTRRQL